MPIAYLCLGSNSGNKISFVQQATSLLVESGLINIIRTSAFYETEPWGNPDQEWFVNAVIEAKTKLSPDELLKLCLESEAKLGRDRSKEERWGTRNIDIDILLYDNIIINTSNLTVPHKYLHERAFALVPLLELIPDYIHPVFNKSLIDLYEAIDCPEDICLYGTRMNFDEN